MTPTVKWFHLAAMKIQPRRSLIGFVLVIGVALGSLVSLRAEELKKITPDEALSYTNYHSKVVVTGTVVEVFETDKAVHLNFGKPRPDQTFSVIVYAYKAPSFPGLKGMKGKTIEATGTISTYEGKPLMYATEPAQLKVVGGGK